MKTKSVVLSLILLIIFGGILEYNFNIEKVENDENTNIVTSIEKFDVKAKKSKKTKTSVKKTTKKKATKKVTKKKTTKKTTKKKTTKKKTTKRTSNQEISELQAYAKNLVINKYGWTEADFNALLKLWYKESGWNVYANGNGCYGIPQAKPGKKMSSEGSDWKTNGKTQIRWGLKYIAGRYGNPTKALKHSDKYHWY